MREKETQRERERRRQRKREDEGGRDRERKNVSVNCEKSRTGQDRTRTRILKLDTQSCRLLKIHKSKQPMARTFAGILYILTKFCYLVIIALLY